MMLKNFSRVRFDSVWKNLNLDMISPANCGDNRFATVWFTPICLHTALNEGGG